MRNPVYIYIYIYIYICVCVCVYIYIYICVCVCVCMCDGGKGLPAHMLAHVCMCTLHIPVFLFSL